MSEDKAESQDTIEQSRCRERTEEEQEAVELNTLLRAFLNAGAGEIRIG